MSLACLLFATESILIDTGSQQVLYKVSDGVNSPDTEAACEDCLSLENA